MKSLFAFILDALFPKKERVLNLEKLSVSGLRSTLSPSTKTPEPWMHSLFAYKTPEVREYIWQIKYTDNKIITKSAGELLSEEILSFIEDSPFSVGAQFLLVAIPASKNHLKEKGFNQTHELCKEITKMTGPHILTYIPGILTKVRETTPQASTPNKNMRMQNLIGAFGIHPLYKTRVADKNIIVIDDVLTTGSTLKEARRALLSAGAKSVHAFTLAH